MDTDDETRLRRLYDEHARALYGFALQLCSGDRGRAEDVVQEVLVRAWRTMDRLDAERESLRPWLFTVARRVVIDEHRRRSARPGEVGGEAAAEQLSAAAAPAELDAALERIVVADALGALSAEHRDVIMQTYYAGRTVAQAAEALGIPAGTAKSRCFYALKALRLALQERGVTA